MQPALVALVEVTALPLVSQRDPMQGGQGRMSPLVVSEKRTRSLRPPFLGTELCIPSPLTSRSSLLGGGDGRALYLSTLAPHAYRKNQESTRNACAAVGTHAMHTRTSISI